MKRTGTRAAASASGSGVVGVRRHAGVGQAQTVRSLGSAAALLSIERARLRRARRAWALSLIVFGGSLAAMFQSCSGGRAGPGGPLSLAETAQDEPTSLKKKPRAASASKNEPADSPTIDKSARALEDMIARMNAEELASASSPDSPPAEPAPASEAPVKPPIPAHVRSAVPRTSTPGTSAANAPASIDEPSPAATNPSPPPARAESSKTVAERKAELATELASLLRPSAADGGDSLAALAPMLALETVQPSAAAAEIEAAVKSLTPEEAAAVRTLRDLLRKIGAEPALAADPGELARLLSEHMDTLAAHAPGEGPQLGTVALCSRVESFGRFTPLASSRMIAGKTNSAILYVEVGRFVQKPAHEAAGDGMVDQDGALIVQLEQEIELWHDGGGGVGAGGGSGTLQWRASPAAIRDHSRTRRHDFFTVQRIDLPSNLSVGKYNLKVTVRDLGASGSPQVQATIPIEIIADPRVASGGRQPLTGVDDRQKPTGPAATPRTARRSEEPDTQPSPARNAPPIVRPVSRSGRP
ncbi:MAG: hypothetical protein IT438_03140 [Phycisphaerales bacterium]|nr:hypothetical protein [Phycisphaerales bacterium]